MGLPMGLSVTQITALKYMWAERPGKGQRGLIRLVWSEAMR